MSEENAQSENPDSKVETDQPPPLEDVKTPVEQVKKAKAALSFVDVKLPPLPKELRAFCEEKRMSIATFVLTRVSKGIKQDYFRFQVPHGLVDPSKHEAKIAKAYLAWIKGAIRSRSGTGGCICCGSQGKNITAEAYVDIPAGQYVFWLVCDTDKCGERVPNMLKEFNDKFEAKRASKN